MSGPFRQIFGQGEATERAIDVDKAFRDSPQEDVPYAGGTSVARTLANGDNTVPINIGRTLTGGLVLSTSKRDSRTTVTVNGNSLIVWTDAADGENTVTLWAF